MINAVARMPTKRTGVVERVVQWIGAHLPRGHALPDDVWQRQHVAILILLWLHAIGVVCYGLIAASTLLGSLVEGGVIALAALLAGVIKGSRQLRAALATLGLLTSSAVLVHLSGGFVEMHFHFLIIMVIVALYQDWVPFLLAIGYVVGEYVLVGLIEPSLFYAQGGSADDAWKWILIHAAFVVAACVAGLVHWRLDESAHARAELILDSAGEGICGIDRHGLVTFVNPAAATMLGAPAKELVGLPFHAILVHARTNLGPCPSETCPMLTIVDEKVRRVSDEVFRRRDGTTFPVEYVSTPILEGKLVAGAVITFDDISERKRAEQQRKSLIREQSARAEAEQAIRARDDLVSTISHDLRNPLSAVKGYAQLLRRRLPPICGQASGRAVEDLGKIEATASKMTSVIDELLDVVHLEMGESIDLDRQPVDLVALARRVAAEYQQTTNHHRLVVVAPPSAVVGNWDARRLERVIANLLSNAIKYSHDGEITVTVDRAEGQGTGWASLSVRDQGIGIRASDLPCIFDRFHHVQSGRGQRIEGVGIGLVSARAVVEAHGGRIDVESQEGVGSTFTVRLPVEGTRKTTTSSRS